MLTAAASAARIQGAEYSQSRSRPGTVAPDRVLRTLTLTFSADCGDKIIFLLPSFFSLLFLSRSLRPLARGFGSIIEEQKSGMGGRAGGRA